MRRPHIARHLASKVSIFDHVIFRYIADKAQHRDALSDADISLSNKISWQWSALIKTCLRAGCVRIEHECGRFKFCAKCQVTCYCSKACQTASWQEHKGACGTAAHACSSHALQSSLVMNSIMKEAAIGENRLPAPIDGKAPVVLRISVDASPQHALHLPLQPLALAQTSVPAVGFASVICARLRQLEIVQCENFTLC